MSVVVTNTLSSPANVQLTSFQLAGGVTPGAELSVVASSATNNNEYGGFFFVPLTISSTPTSSLLSLNGSVPTSATYLITNFTATLSYISGTAPFGIVLMQFTTNSNASLSQSLGSTSIIGFNGVSKFNGPIMSLSLTTGNQTLTFKDFIVQMPASSATLSLEVLTYSAASCAYNLTCNFTAHSMS